MGHLQVKQFGEVRHNDRAATKRLDSGNSRQIITSSATRISISPNCQASHWPGRLPERCAVVSSIPIGRLRPKNVEGIMRSVQALAVAALLLLPAFDVASAVEPQTSGLLPVFFSATPRSAPFHVMAAHSASHLITTGFLHIIVVLH